MKKFTPKSFGSSRSGEPTVRLNHTGLITFNRFAGKLMGLANGKKVVLLQDEQQEKRIGGERKVRYAVAVDTEGFALRIGRSNQFSFNCKPLVSQISTDLGKQLDKNKIKSITFELTETVWDGKRVFLLS